MASLVRFRRHQQDSIDFVIESNSNQSAMLKQEKHLLRKTLAVNLTITVRKLTVFLE